LSDKNQYLVRFIAEGGKYAEGMTVFAPTAKKAVELFTEKRGGSEKVVEIYRKVFADEMEEL
jgi:hypothetical protein